MISAYIMPHPPAAIPEVGYKDIDSMGTTLDAFSKASRMIKSDCPETIVVISPHAPMYSDGFYLADGDSCRGDMSQFGAPEAMLSFDIDTELRDELCKLCDKEKIPYGLGDVDNNHMDHGSIVPLSFVTKTYNKFRLLRVSSTYLKSTVLLKMGSLIERAAAHVGRKITIIASADLSHRLKEDGPYGLAEEGLLFDTKITEVIKNFDIEKVCELMDDHDFLDKAGQCGTPAITMMMGALQNYKVTPEFLSYEAPFGVGYAICRYKCESMCVRLAKSVLETYIKTGKSCESWEEAFEGENTPESLKNCRAGVFVCIKKHGDLRGCIGTFMPTTDNIASEICKLAIEAGTRDSRFSPVTIDELEELEYTVDILSSPKPAGFKDLDVKRYGVIVTNGDRRGLLLPNLDGVDTVELQLAIALDKAGINPKEGFTIYRFMVERHT